MACPSLILVRWSDKSGVKPSLSLSHIGKTLLLQINSFCQGIGSLSKSEFLLSFFSISVSPGSEIAFWVVTHYEEPRNEIVCPRRHARQVLK